MTAVWRRSTEARSPEQRVPGPSSKGAGKCSRIVEHAAAVLACSRGPRFTNDVPASMPNEKKKLSQAQHEAQVDSRAKGAAASKAMRAARNNAEDKGGESGGHAEDKSGDASASGGAKAAAVPAAAALGQSPMRTKRKSPPSPAKPPPPPSASQVTPCKWFTPEPCARLGWSRGAPGLACGSCGPIRTSGSPAHASGHAQCAFNGRRSGARLAPAVPTSRRCRGTDRGCLYFFSETPGISHHLIIVSRRRVRIGCVY